MGRRGFFSLGANVDEQTRKDMRKACQIMGGYLHGTDHFIRTCLWWLSSHGKFALNYTGDGWHVQGSDYSSIGENLPEALCGAVFTIESLEGGDA